MPNTWIVVLLSLGAALSFALSSSLKHLSAGRVPDAQSMHPGKLAHFVRATVTHRVWLAGLGCDVIGVSLQTLALHLGALGVVQFLLLSSLLFALVLRGRLEGEHITRRQALWAALLTVSLGGFLWVASPTSTAGAPDPGPAIVGGVLAAALAVLFIVLGRREPNGARAAALLGVAVGVLYASTAALLKTVTDIAGRGPAALFTSWPLYVLVAVGVSGMLLAQLTFQAGPLAASLPATATMDPLVSLAIGVFVYHEQIRPGVGAGLWLIVLFGVLGTAVVQLSRAPERLAAPS